MKALILAAGKGTRLRPITDYVPKPMVPIHGKPLLEWVLLHLMFYGIREYVIAVSYLAEQIENYFGDGSRWEVEIEYSHGPQPAGKAGEIWRARKLLGGEDSFLVVPGDTISHLDYRDLMGFHAEHGGAVSVALSTRYRLEVGFAEVDQHNRIRKFREKTNLGRPVSTGDYVLNSSILDYIGRLSPNGKEVDLPGDVFPLLLDDQVPLYGYVRDFAWWDIGKINEFEELAHMPMQEVSQILYWHPVALPGYQFRQGPTGH